ncbi:MAG: hypothetical protein II387_08080, partial [Oscillospiraceae bacterium]|nr:hypothetical protein [Oscillospiraceae bacterium]
KAEAEGVALLKSAGLSEEQIVQLRSLEAFTAAADGRATKIIVPSEIAGMAGLAKGLIESVSDAKEGGEKRDAHPEH